MDSNVSQTRSDLTDSRLNRKALNFESSRTSEIATDETINIDNTHSPEDATYTLIEQWAEIAVSRAMVRGINHPAGMIAKVVGIKGALGFGHSEKEALNELKSVLIDWVTLKLDDGDDDIPSMEGVHLVTDR